MYQTLRKLPVVTIVAVLGMIAGYQWGRIATTQKERRVQEKLTARLNESEQKLERRLLANKNAILKLSPQRPFVKNLAKYSEEQRALIQRHASAAVSALGAEPDPFDKVAAVTAYAHQLLEPKPFQDGRAFDVLGRGGSDCGGFAICAGELLEALGIQSDFVFLRGGTFGGHAMLQAFLGDGSGALVDPYFGVIYIDSLSGKPAPTSGVVRGQSVVPHHAIHKHAREASQIISYTRLADAFSPTAEPSSPAYRFPDLFRDADGVYEANSGAGDFIHIPLQPGHALGCAEWTASTDQPLPWTALQLCKLPGGKWLSWAFTLGNMPMGNQVSHTYSLTGLVPGRRYRLTLLVATAGNTPSSALSGPVVTVQQVSPWGGTQVQKFEERGFDPEKVFVPLRMEIEFEAAASEMSFVGVAAGYFMLNCISLEAVLNPEP